MKSMNEDNRGQRIAENTLMLYIRMLFMLFLGLFTSRIVLAALGETDYGVYNVVGGVVAMFTIISGALQNNKSAVVCVARIRYRHNYEEFRGGGKGQRGFVA